MKRLTVIPDTNLFVQCEPLDKLDWRLLGDFDEISIVVPKSTQREIDKHKNSGNDRLAQRTRSASTLLRQVLLSEDDVIVIRESGPRVTLRLGSDLPSEALAGKLDYSKPDDELVGAAWSYRAAHEAEEVRVLTHDTGPLASAKFVGFPFAVVPEQWRLKPENNEQEKKLNAALAEVKRLSKTFPNLVGGLRDEAGETIERIQFIRPIFPALTLGEIAGLMDAIKQRCPIATDFGREDGRRRPPGYAAGLGMMQHTYTPASETEIAKYRDETYPQWLTDCAYQLGLLHHRLEHRARPALVTFVADNTGTQPARDALVTFAARGAIAIMPPAPRSDEAEETEQPPPSLPNPPQPPRGSWSSPLGSIVDIYTMANQRIGLPESYLPNISHHLLAAQGRHQEDPNDFYIRGKRPREPVDSFQWRCAQWRHTQEEPFDCEIHCASEAEVVEGALYVCIEAENLPDKFELTVPVRIERPQRATLDEAKKLAERLARS